MKISEVIVSHPTYSSLEFRAAGARPGSSGQQVGPALDRTPSSEGHSLTHTHSDQDSQHTSSAHVHVLGTEEETGVPRENPCKHRRRCKLHTVAQRGIDLVSSSTLYQNDDIQGPAV